MSGVWQQIALTPGLHIVATPIGRARDITLSALDTLASADSLAAEDTRTLRRLMEMHGIPLGDRQLVSYHDMNGSKVRPRLLAWLREGRSVAYASDAGTPMVADPGYALVRDALEEGITVTGTPGPVAAIHALTLSGLPTDRFAFAGFLPQAGGARRSMLDDLAGFSGTVIFYDSPRRCSSNIREIGERWGGDRRAAVCRELTKRFEEVRRGTLQELGEALEGQTLKGEIVLCVGRSEAAESMDDVAIEAALRTHMATRSLKDAVAEVAGLTGRSRRDVYQMALRLAENE